jgi:hypothetical protein
LDRWPPGTGALPTRVEKPAIRPSNIGIGSYLGEEPHAPMTSLVRCMLLKLGDSDLRANAILAPPLRRGRRASLEAPLPARSERVSPIAMLVRKGFENGLLWVLPVDVQPVWAGRGTFKLCVVCRVKIASYEKQCDVPGPRGALPTHLTCLQTWLAQSDEVRTKLAHQSSGTERVDRQ